MSNILKLHNIHIKARQLNSVYVQSICQIFTEDWNYLEQNCSTSRSKEYTRVTLIIITIKITCLKCHQDMHDWLGIKHCSSKYFDPLKQCWCMELGVTQSWPTVKLSQLLTLNIQPWSRVSSRVKNMSSWQHDQQFQNSYFKYEEDISSVAISWLETNNQFCKLFKSMQALERSVMPSI